MRVMFVVVGVVVLVSVIFSSLILSYLGGKRLNGVNVRYRVEMEPT